ncbi:MAG: chorismate mutase [Acidobacteria bacterium]|nr:MAG: chorismate mutase [Acidobacteriota bacterium]REK08437.1 MAG: chorismate mutase [Acidobacteriota bacterium]
MVQCRGVRGATTVEENSRSAILLATGELLWYLIERNGIVPDDVASAYFTTTRDLDAEFPALAARKLGWLDVALICGHEMEVPGALSQCIRVLLHWNTTRTAKEIEHVYIRGARDLRPDQQALLELPDVPIPRFDLD